LSEVWRLLSSDGVGAAEGLALDEALMGRYARSAPERPPTLRLYSYRDHCALVGRYQNIEAELDLEACTATGTEIGRRLTGGGAIVMGHGQLGIAYVDRAPVHERPRETIAKLSAALVRGLGGLGIMASFEGKNDLEVAGRKIAGLGLYADQSGAMLFHASVLCDLDVGFMVQVLKIPAAKLDGRAIAAVGERVTTVSAVTGSRHDATTLRPFVARGFSESFDVLLEPEKPDEDEQARAEALAEGRYRSQSWLHERSASPDANGSALLKTPAGLARIYLATHGDVVKSALVAGDFNELPAELAALEAALRWRRLDHDSVLEVVARSGAARALGVGTEDLVAAVMMAGDASTEAPGGAVRASAAKS